MKDHNNITKKIIKYFLIIILSLLFLSACANNINSDLDKIKINLEETKNIRFEDFDFDKIVFLNFNKNKYNYEIIEQNENQEKNEICFSFLIIDKQNHQKSKIKKIKINNFIKNESILKELNEKIKTIKIDNYDLSNIKIYQFNLDNLKFINFDKEIYEFFITKKEEIYEDNEYKLNLELSLVNKKYQNIFSSEKINLKLEGFKKLDHKEILDKEIANIIVNFDLDKIREDKKENEYLFDDFKIYNYDKSNYKITNKKIKLYKDYDNNNKLKRIRLKLTFTLKSINNSQSTDRSLIFERLF